MSKATQLLNGPAGILTLSSLPLCSYPPTLNLVNCPVKPHNPSSVGPNHGDGAKASLTQSLCPP